MSRTRSCSAGVPREVICGAAVEFLGDVLEILRAMDGKVGALREGLAQQPVGVLVRSALPGTGRGADGHVGRGGEGFVRRLMPSVRHASALLIPCPIN